MTGEHNLIGKKMCLFWPCQLMNYQDFFRLPTVIATAFILSEQNMQNIKKSFTLFSRKNLFSWQAIPILNNATACQRWQYYS